MKRLFHSNALRLAGRVKRQPVSPVTTEVQMIFDDLYQEPSENRTNKPTTGPARIHRQPLQTKEPLDLSKINRKQRNEQSKPDPVLKQMETKDLLSIEATRKLFSPEEVEQRRNAIMELYDTRHEFEDTPNTGSDSNEWYVTSNTQTTAEAIKPRWLQAVDEATKRQEGIKTVDASNEFLQRVVQTLEDERASNMTVLDVSDKCEHMQYLVIVDGRSPKHIYSMADSVRRQFKHIDLMDDSLPHTMAVEGADSDWIVLDLGSIMLHCFTPESRAFFDLETLWTQMDPVNPIPQSDT